MKKTKRLLSALTALTITASAFAGLAIPASAATASTATFAALDSDVEYWGKKADDLASGLTFTPDGTTATTINVAGTVKKLDSWTEAYGENSEGWYMPYRVSGLNANAVVYLESAQDYTYTDPTTNKTYKEITSAQFDDADGKSYTDFISKLTPEKKTTTIIVDLDGEATEYDPVTYTVNAEDVTLEGYIPVSPVTPGQNNSINISENFDSDVVNAEEYTWDVETTNIFGNKGSGAADTVLTGNALSLSDNANKNILTFNQGVGGTQKDIEFTFDAGTVKGFGQANVTWEMVFKSTDGIEMFKIRFVSGNWSRTVSLVVGDKVQATNYVYADEKFVNSKCYISFNDNGGVVTFGNVSAAFENAVDLGTISVTYDNGNCYSRPFVVDNFAIKTVDKEKVTFIVASSETGQSVEGAELKIGNDVYTIPASGKVEAYYLPGDYTYELKLAKHKAVSGTLNVIKAGGQKEVYEFNNIASDITEATLIEAAYTVTATPQLSSVKSSTVTITDGKYSFEKDVPTEPVVGTETKYFLWNSLEGMKPLSTVEKTVVELNNDKNITLEYVGDPKPAKIEIAGGDEYIYLPATGTASSEAFTATVYDQSDLVMDSAEVEWSLPGQPSTISIGSDGVVTLTPDYSLTDDNGVDVTVRATVKGTTVTADTSIHIHNTARATSWDIVGPAVIKDGTAATYSVANIKDQYGNAFDGESEFTLTSSDEKATISELSITPNVGTSRTEEVTITVALSTDATKKVDKKVTVYGYDFYEPGTGVATYGEPRMEVVNGVNSIVWPKSASSAATTTITLPVPVALTAGSAKMITFDNIPVEKTVGSQERSLHFVNSNGDDVINIDFAGDTVVTAWSKVSGNYTGTEIGKLNAIGSSSSATFVLKTDTNGITSAILSYNGKTLSEYQVSETAVTDIAAIKLVGGSGAPDSRMLTLTNIIIADSDVPEVEIVGDDQLAKISGLTASKKFRGSIFSLGEGETYTWSVADASGNPINGVSIDQNGVLSVTDAVAANTVAVISYTSSLSTTEAPKLAKHEVTIKDFAAVKSAELTGPVAVNAGETVNYKVENVVDEYGDAVTMPVAFEITEGSNIASIDSAGVVTTTGTLGSYTVKATIGNPGKTIEKTLTAEVAKYAESGTTTEASIQVDVTTLANYAADTKYLVTTATADGTLVNQTDNVAHTAGKITVDMTGASKYEVSPIYTYDNVGNVSGGKDIPVCDGRYEFKFVKANMTRGDIYVNGIMVGNNVDQDGKGKTPAASSPEWVVDDVLVQGGKAVVTMKDNTSDMKSIEVRKNPSILERKTHLYILGDSLVADYHKTFDYSTGAKPVAGDAQTGWGQVLHEFISDDINVTNLAESGNYAKGLYSPAFAGALASAEEGDYIIIECGYNDANYSSESEMKTYLEKMADDCKAKGVTIIMSGPNFGPTRGDTNSASAKLTSGVLASAEAKGVLGINLSSLGKAYYEEKGWTSEYWSQNFNCYYDDTVQDNLHLSYHGAMLQASLIAQAISDAQNDTENTELAASLAGLKLDKTAKTLIDSTGATLTFQIQ